MTKIYEHKKMRLIRQPNVRFIGGARAKIYRHPKIKNQDFYLYKTIHHANGTDRIFRPILTPEEYAKRKRNFYNSAARFLSHVEEAKNRDNSGYC